jgi:hypothetical protein
MVLAIAPAAPVPKEMPPYFPTQVGTKWVYQDGDTEEVQVITAVEESTKGKVITVGKVKDGQVVPWYEMLASDKSLSKLWCPSGQFDPPLCQLKLPPRPGDKWEFDSSLSAVRFEYKGAARVREPEWVEVPAGRYWAVAVEVDVTGGPNDTPFQKTVWFAPRIGRVKEVWSFGREMVLKSFTPGKD